MSRIYVTDDYLEQRAQARARQIRLAILLLALGIATAGSLAGSLGMVFRLAFFDFGSN